METTPIKDEVAAKAATKPLKVFRLEHVSASVFAHTRAVNGRDVTFHEVSFSRSYQKNGSTRYVKSFGYGDLSKLAFVMKQAEEFLLGLQYQA